MCTDDIVQKRRLANDGYYESLHRDNVDLVPAPITSVSEAAIHTPSGTYPADVIVFAIGFHANTFAPGIRITGRDKVELKDAWNAREHRGPSAYRGFAVAGFPNFFTLVGPNSVTGHSSVLIATER